MLRNILLLLPLVFALTSYATNKASYKSGFPQKKNPFYLSFLPEMPSQNVYEEKLLIFSPKASFLIDKTPRVAIR